MNTAVLVDIDGTLCDTRHRDYLIHERNDWYAHSLACTDDPPIPGTIRLVNELAEQHLIYLCSGRGTHAWANTVDWLDRHQVTWHDLLLRAPDDRTNNSTYKLNRVKEIEAKGVRFVLAIDDYHKTASALSLYGIPTVLVTSFTTHGNPEELLPLIGRT